MAGQWPRKASNDLITMPGTRRRGMTMTVLEVYSERERERVGWGKKKLDS